MSPSSLTAFCPSLSGAQAILHHKSRLLQSGRSPCAGGPSPGSDSPRAPPAGHVPCRAPARGPATGRRLCESPPLLGQRLQGGHSLTSHRQYGCGTVRYAVTPSAQASCRSYGLLLFRVYGRLCSISPVRACMHTLLRAYSITYSSWYVRAAVRMSLCVALHNDSRPYVLPCIHTSMRPYAPASRLPYLRM